MLHRLFMWVYLLLKTILLPESTTLVKFLREFILRWIKIAQSPHSQHLGGASQKMRKKISLA